MVDSRRWCGFSVVRFLRCFLGLMYLGSQHCHVNNKTKTHTREFSSYDNHHTRTMGKRKHAAEEVYSAHDRVRYPQAYGLNHLPANECRERLLDALENKSACQKFGSATTPSLRPIIHNMVTTMHVDTMGKKIDLNTVWRCMGNSSYDRKRFAAISLRIQSPKTTALLFSSGKVTKMNTLGCNRNRMPL